MQAKHLFTAFVLALTALLVGAAPVLASAAAAAVVLTVHDAIGPASADYLIRGIAKAKES
ncbi:MAG: hypothetical protein GZ085_13395, partial [Sulfuriferula multivorans]|nr:hypothetical protein [Sulfuriferula multivorans]